MKAQAHIHYSEGNFIEHLITLGLAPGKIVASMEHEKSHINKAKELGYKADYCVVLTEDEIIPSTKLYEAEKIPKEHLIEIMSAPEILSPSDIHKINSLKGTN